MSVLRPPEPILVVDLFPLERAALLELLDFLAPADWTRPTAAGDWTVKDVAAHLVGDDLGRISADRDGHVTASRDGGDGASLRAFIDRRNREWVAAARRLSPRVVRSLLETSGREFEEHARSLDPFVLGRPVSWAGPDAAPAWLDLARELTERWHHQQQIREAVGAPLLSDPRFLRPVLATFAFALPAAYRGVAAPAGTTVALTVHGPSGADWAVVRERRGWSLARGRPDSAAAHVALDEDSAWRMFTGMLELDEVRRRAEVDGDVALGQRALTAFALVS